MREALFIFIIVNFLRILKKPEYLFHPHQIKIRLSNYFSQNKLNKKIVRLFWGESFLVNPQETIGYSISNMGLYDLALTEVLWRLLKPGMTFVDIGANIGYFSRLARFKVGEAGKLFSFEPNPLVLDFLKTNTESYKNIKIFTYALSNNNGRSKLFIPKKFSQNTGIASLSQSEDATALDIELQTLDSILSKETFPSPIDVIKIDVEGHEEAVFSGGEQTLKRTGFVVFEDFLGTESKAIKTLQNHGFKIQGFYKGLFGVEFVTINERAKLPLNEPPNYIAYKDEHLFKEIFSQKKWECFQ